MKTSLPLSFLAFALTALGAGCAVPSIYGFEDPELFAFDPALVGTWVAEEDTTTYVVTPGDEDRRTYTIVASETRRDETKELELTGVLVRLDGGLILDVTLAKDEREEVAEQYGMLLLPVHQFYRLEAVEEGMRVHMLDDGWMKSWPGTLDMDDVPVLVAQPHQLATVLTAALRDDEAWEDSFVVRRKE